MKLSTAEENGFVCPGCGSALSKDHIGRGFVRHLERRTIETGGTCNHGAKEKDAKNQVE